jgi:dihydroorotate dehydrogenase
MNVIYESILRPRLFKKSPEEAHAEGIRALRRLGSLGLVRRLMERANRLPVDHEIELFGLKFPNGIGVAAGMDKDAECVQGFAALGFGHVEVGTVTPRPQEGNPAPRLFRYPAQGALINRMGFNNGGAEAVRARLEEEAPKDRRRIILGINIGKQKDTPLEEAAQDYVSSFKMLAAQADYFTLNVSSPNTPNLRELQEKNRLLEVLRAVRQAAEERARETASSPVPLLLKIAPDLSFRHIDAVLEAIAEAKFSGIIATNTTVSRPGLMKGTDEDGGLSGKPLQRLSTHVINYIYKATSGKLPIIGAGGVDDAASAGEKVDAGASLLQLYTGLVYRGPFVGKALARVFKAHQDDWV